jgi:DNA polymerase-3 subunit epsilon
MHTYSFVDIETNGGSKVIEIGVVTVQDWKIIDQFESLVDPDTYLPPGITRLTGISAHQLEKAPSFRNLHEQILDRLSKTTFVAHNVSFDYSILKSEFNSVNVRLSLPRLCTMKLSRSAFPSLPSHSLDSLINHFNLPAMSRHRALSDALSTFYFAKYVFNHINQEIFSNLGWSF